MNPYFPSSKMPAELSASTEHQLKMYAVAAGAAGVGLLALVQPAEAKIVYTRTNQLLGSPHQPVYIDLNHDGINDFVISTYYASSTIRRFGIRAYQVPKFTGANRIMGKGNYAYALRAGVEIGPKKQFNALHSRMGSVTFTKGLSTKTYFRGPWANDGKGVKNRYLGLQFVVNGKIHFGWARVSMAYLAQDKYLFGRLTGYAYETIPNKPIVAGATHGPDVVVKHATLGELAAGRK